MMTKPLTFVVLAALIFVVVGCAGDPPQKPSGAVAVAPSGSGGNYAPWTVPIRFFE